MWRLMWKIEKPIISGKNYEAFMWRKNRSSFEGENEVKSSNFNESGQLIKRGEIHKLILWFMNACKLENWDHTCAVD